MSAFDKLISQIDEFIRKHYKNQMVRGAIFFTGVFLLTFLLVVTLEYFGRFNSVIRAILFFSFIIANGFILTRLIIVPYLKLNALGKRIDRLQASKIIGDFFPTISDRLLNTLQLSSQLNNNSRDYELIKASVQQRSATLSKVPFAEAIDLGENKKYLVWIFPVVLLITSIALFSPDFFKNSTERVVYFSEEFVDEGAFNLILNAEDNQIEEGEDFSFSVQADGNELPDKVYLISDRGKFLLDKSSKNSFKGLLTQVRENTSIKVQAVDSRDVLIESAPINIHVISKTALGKLQATIVYPKYLDLEDEVIENASDLTVPEGSTISWSVLAKNSSEATFKLGVETAKFDREGFSFKHLFSKSERGQIILKNKESGNRDTTTFDVTVIPDQYPAIQVEELKDSLKDGVRYFSGNVSDDHGIRSLQFVYTITKKSGVSSTKKLNVGRVSGTESLFNYAVDFRRENIAIEDRIEYYFIVTDNDGVNGGKTSRSRTYIYKIPTLEEVNEKRDSEQEKAKEDLNSIQKKAEQFAKDLDRIRKESMNSNKSDWNMQNSVEQLKEDHQSILEDLQQLQEEISNSTEEKNQLSEIDEELLKQEELINDLLEELMDDELKDLLDQLEELMKEQNKNELEKNFDQMEMSSEDMKKQLDRSLEMLKNMQVNEKIDDIEDELNKLAEEQDELRDELEKNGSSEELEKKQEELNEKFDDVKKDLQKLDSLNKSLERPMDLDDFDEESNEIKDQMNEAKEQLEKNKEKKAGENQKGASEKMKQMANQLDAMQAQSNQEQQQEDIDMLRGILESLVSLSFSQEDVMNRLANIGDTDPAYQKQTRIQRKIIDDTKVVKDSLYALAKRQPKIASFIDKELNQIDVNQDLALEDIDERRRGMLKAHQQYVMTSYNNLALMLNESLQQMQQQMQQMMPGSGSCNKPGGSGMPKPGDSMNPGDMKKMLQEQLKQMQKGPNEGGNKPGQKPGQGTMPFGMGNKEIAKMAAQQSAIRKRLEQMRNELNKDGKGTGNKLNPLIQELEEQEKDLVNKRFDRDLIKRQKDILTRLLESEKALIERGLDEKRESKEGKNENYSNQIQFEEYNKEKLRQIELLRSVDPTYKKYYKDRANEYFNRMLLY